MVHLQKIINPTIGILTNIGSAHDEGFENISQKIKEKLKLFKDVGVLIYNKNKTIDAFLNPNTNFIFTTPGDSYRKSKKGYVKNPNVRNAKETIIQYCLDKNYAYWNLYEIMGGFGSMQKWFNTKLSVKDKIHFSTKGYILQGEMLYYAIYKSYNNYLQRNK